ncbi:glycerophosphodiester phosphodiesterase [Aquimarina addita]|uniref:Glycerophosphodiester phosphodiesterase n=1 Tax=Aquimarina addita TaxID=870485 RepID=A0ABP6UU01_9FLAO
MKIFGHRGAAGLVAENTIESIVEAIKHGVDGVEIDVHRCKSGELIVIHDETLERTTTGVGNVADHTLQELQELRTKEGFIIPTLIQVLECINGQCELNVELKGKCTAMPTIEVLETYIAKTEWDYNQFIISSFDHAQLFEIKEMTSQFRLGVLTEEDITHALPIAKKLQAFSVHLPITSITIEEVREAKELGYQVYIWTVNLVPLIVRSKTWKVDGIITDFPNFV